MRFSLIAYILLLTTGFAATESTSVTVSRFFAAVQNNSGVGVNKSARGLTQALTSGSPEVSLASMRKDPSRRGVLVYTGVYGQPGNRIVRILCFADFSKWPKNEVIGGLAKVKSWFFDYDSASGLAADLASRLGVSGANSNGMLVTTESVKDDYVAIFLSKDALTDATHFSPEVGNFEIVFY